MRMGRKSATPHLRKKGKAYYYDHGGRPRRWTPLGSDRAKALAEYDRLEGREPNKTFGDLARWFLATQTATLAANTRENYERHTYALIRMFGEAAPDLIKPEHIAIYREKCTPGNAAVRVGLLKTIFSKAVELGLAEKNPAREVRRPKTAVRARYLTDAEFIAIRSHAPDFLAVAMDVAYASGLRPGDVFRIRLSDIGPDGLYVAMQKTGKRVIYELTPELSEAIGRAKALPRSVKGMHLFCDRRGQPYKAEAVQRRFAAAARAAGVMDAQFRDIRAKNATDDPTGAQKRLGHASAKMTERYVKAREVEKVTPLRRRL